MRMLRSVMPRFTNPCRPTRHGSRRRDASRAARARSSTAGTGLARGRADHIGAARHISGALVGGVLPGRVWRGRGLHRSGLHLCSFRRAGRRLGAPHRYADGGDAGGGEHRVVARAHLLDRLHGARSAQAALLRLSVVLHLRHADAGDGRQPRADVFRLGGRRPRLISSDRLLVSPALGECGRHQGLRRQPCRRLRLRARYFRRLLSLRLGQSRHDLRQCRGGC